MNPVLKIYRVIITESELKQLNDSGKKQFPEASYSPKQTQNSVQLYLRWYEGHNNVYEQRAKANEFAKRILSAHGQPWDSRLGEPLDNDTPLFIYGCPASFQECIKYTIDHYLWSCFGPGFIRWVDHKKYLQLSRNPTQYLESRRERKSKHTDNSRRIVNAMTQSENAG